MPIPGENAWDSLTTVACPSPGNCVMGGTFRDSNGFFQGLIGSLHGRAVTTRQAPLPARGGIRPSVALGAITCPEPGTCFAVGARTDIVQGLGPFAVVEALSSGSWKATTVHLPGDTAWLSPPGGLSWQTTKPVQIACASSTSCVVIGTLYHQKTGAYTLLELTLSAGRWTPSLIKIPDVPNVFPSASSVGIESLACPAEGSCVAAGSLWDAEQQASAIVLQQQPRGWKVYEFGDMQKCLICYPGAPGIGFSAISCWGPASCIAVGDTVAVSTGNSWKDIGAAPDLRHDDGTVLSDVSCREDGVCVAVGFDTAHPPGLPLLLDTYAHGKWTSFSETGWHNPPSYDQPISGPSAISCPRTG